MLIQNLNLITWLLRDSDWMHFYYASKIISVSNNGNFCEGHLLTKIHVIVFYKVTENLI